MARLQQCEIITLTLSQGRFVTLALSLIEEEIIHEHSCHHRRHYFDPCYPARQFRVGHPATQGLTALHTITPVLQDHMDPLLVSRTQDAPREPTRSLPELLWSPFTHLLAGSLGGSPD